MKLHLGCGKRYIPGWVHVDLDWFEHIDFNSPVYPLDIFEDSVADIIYASHILEYFDDAEAEMVLLEWARVLKPGGIIRLAVPNFETLIEIYEITKSIKTIVGPLYGKMIINDNSTIYHKTVYDFSKLEKLLLKTGFIQICHFDWRDTEHSSVDDHSQAYFPHMNKEDGKLVSLNVEARLK